MYPFEYREDILALLEEHVTQNIVKVSCVYSVESKTPSANDRLAMISTGNVLESHKALFSRRYYVHSSMAIWNALARRASGMTLGVYGRANMPLFWN